jgi:hypothetical protein
LLILLLLLLLPQIRVQAPKTIEWFVCSSFLIVVVEWREGREGLDDISGDYLVETFAGIPTFPRLALVARFCAAGVVGAGVEAAVLGRTFRTG